MGSGRWRGRHCWLTLLRPQPRGSGGWGGLGLVRLAVFLGPGTGELSAPKYRDEGHVALVTCTPPFPRSCVPRWQPWPHAPLDAPLQMGLQEASPVASERGRGGGPGGEAHGGAGWAAGICRAGVWFSLTGSLFLCNPSQPRLPRPGRIGAAWGASLVKSTPLEYYLSVNLSELLYGPLLSPPHGISPGALRRLSGSFPGRPPPSCRAPPPAPPPSLNIVRVPPLRAPCLPSADQWLLTL